MTYQFRTMLELEGDITYRFSIAGVTNRHSTGTSGRIRQLINVSIQEFRELIALGADGAYLKASEPATFASVSATSPAVTGETYAELDWPLDAVGVYGVRVQLTSGGRWYPLKRIPFAAYQDYQLSGLLSLPAQGDPIGYTTRELPKGGDADPTVETVGKVMITPVPTRGSFRLWYLQAWAPQTADGAKFFGLAQGQEWVILNTIMKMATPDNEGSSFFTKVEKQLARVEARITARAQKLEAGDALEPRDARWDGLGPDIYPGEL